MLTVNILMIGVICFATVRCADAHDDPPAVSHTVTMSDTGAYRSGSVVDHAIVLYERGEWEHAESALIRLLETAQLSQRERSRARFFLGLTSFFQGKKRATIEWYKTLIREDSGCDTHAIRIFLGERQVPLDVMAYFAQAAIEVRHDEIEARKAVLARHSRGAALLRSTVVPGWGQRYQGYRARSVLMTGLVTSAMVYAAVAEQDYRKARNTYRRAPKGADFDDLYGRCITRRDRATRAVGVVGALWVLTMLDATLQGPNLSETRGGMTLTPQVTPEGLHVVYCARW